MLKIIQIKFLKFAYVSRPANGFLLKWRIQFPVRGDRIASLPIRFRTGRTRRGAIGILTATLRREVCAVDWSAIKKLYEYGWKTKLDVRRITKGNKAERVLYLLDKIKRSFCPRGNLIQLFCTNKETRKLRFKVSVTRDPHKEWRIIACLEWMF